MTVLPSTTKKTVQITNQLESKSTFAVDPDTGEQVFIGSRIAQMQGLKEGDTAEVFVIPNDRNPNVEWYAVYVKRVGDLCTSEPTYSVPKDPAPVSPIRVFLEDGPATTRQVADHLGVDTPDATRRLMALHRHGTVARAEVRKRADQEKASYVVWALDAHEFLPEDDDG